MVKKLNRSGYILVEIILASVITFAVAFYLSSLTIKLKTRNDDMLAKTLAMTDQAIIQNQITKYIDKGNFDCSKLNNSTGGGKVIKYDNNIIDILNDYVSVGTISCQLEAVSSGNRYHISLPMTIDLLNENYDVDLYYMENAPSGG